MPTTTSSAPATTTTNPTPVSAQEAKVSAIIERVSNAELAESVAEVLSADGEITVDAVQYLVNNEEFESLDEETLEVISEAISAAPDEVKEEFEAEVNVFSGTFDNYIPSGSKISVEDRRVVIAVTATISASIAAPASGGGRRRR